MEKQITLKVDRDFVVKFLWVLIGIEAGLVLADALFNYAQLMPTAQLRKLFNIAREDSLANWVSSVQLLFVGLTLLVLYAATDRARAPRERRTWGFFAGLFLFLAADDGGKIHERVGPAVRQLAGGEQSAVEVFFQWVGGYSWHTVLLPVYLGLGAWLLYFAWNEFRHKNTRWFLAGGLFCWAAAIGLDYFEGGFRFVEGDYFWGWDRYTISHFQKSAEEFLEMLGASLLWVSFVRHLKGRIQLFQIRFGGETAVLVGQGARKAPKLKKKTRKKAA